MPDLTNEVAEPRTDKFNDAMRDLFANINSLDEKHHCALRRGVNVKTAFTKTDPVCLEAIKKVTPDYFWDRQCRDRNFFQIFYYISCMYARQGRGATGSISLPAYLGKVFHSDAETTSCKNRIIKLLGTDGRDAERLIISVEYFVRKANNDGWNINAYALFRDLTDWTGDNADRSFKVVDRWSNEVCYFSRDRTTIQGKEIFAESNKAFFDSIDHLEESLHCALRRSCGRFYDKHNRNIKLEVAFKSVLPDLYWRMIHKEKKKDGNSRSEIIIRYVAGVHARQRKEGLRKNSLPNYLNKLYNEESATDAERKRIVNLLEISRFDASTLIRALEYFVKKANSEKISIDTSQLLNDLMKWTSSNANISENVKDHWGFVISMRSFQEEL